MEFWEQSKKYRVRCTLSFFVSVLGCCLIVPFIIGPFAWIISTKSIFLISLLAAFWLFHALISHGTLYLTQWFAIRSGRLSGDTNSRIKVLTRDRIIGLWSSIGMLIGLTGMLLFSTLKVETV